jgi:hypothetical protein
MKDITDSTLQGMAGYRVLEEVISESEDSPSVGILDECTVNQEWLWL